MARNPPRATLYRAEPPHKRQTAAPTGFQPFSTAFRVAVRRLSGSGSRPAILDQEGVMSHERFVGLTIALAIAAIAARERDPEE
jgi:hypothetical protein